MSRRLGVWFIRLRGDRCVNRGAEEEADEREEEGIKFGVGYRVVEEEKWLERAFNARCCLSGCRIERKTGVPHQKGDPVTI